MDWSHSFLTTLPGESSTSRYQYTRAAISSDSEEDSDSELGQTHTLMNHAHHTHVHTHTKYTTNCVHELRRARALPQPPPFDVPGLLEASDNLDRGADKRDADSKGSKVRLATPEAFGAPVSLASTLQKWSGRAARLFSVVVLYLVWAYAHGEDGGEGYLGGMNWREKASPKVAH